MRLGPTTAVLAVLAAVVMTAPAAHAFTMEGGSDSSAYATPKFDLEDQVRAFRTPGTAASGLSNNFSTPLGPGSFQMGVQSGFSPNSPFTGSGLSSQPYMREQFNRIVTPENMR